MRRIGRLLIVAGPTACGKSTFLEKLSTQELAPFRLRLGLGAVEQLPRTVSNRLELLSDVDLPLLVLHHDFLWPPDDSSFDVPWGKRPLPIVADADEVTLVTVWTPPTRLERQLLDGKLRAAFSYNGSRPMLLIKAGIFRILPRFILRRLSTGRLLAYVNRRFPGHLLMHHLLLLRTYSSTERVAAMYRRWMEFCDIHIPAARDHLIVEFDKEFKFYSRREWEDQVMRK